MCLSFSALDSGDLRVALRRLGTKDVFDADEAELFGIIKDTPELNQRLVLNHFVHKAKMDVISGAKPTSECADYGKHI